MQLLLQETVIPLMDLGKENWKNFLKDSALYAIKITHDLWAEVKIPELTETWKKLNTIIVDDFEGFKIPVKEITADVVETARELKLEVEPKESEVAQSCLFASP